ncbi:YesL family protein [Pseudactinotalea sp. Z1732]|uniref:YesL family protein n=1 Tax=Micrococcales TaxID=85006 RepID=UPI003C7AE274
MVSPTQAKADRAFGVGRAWEFADAVLFTALLNLLVLVMTLAGGVLFGLAPALTAAVTCARARLRGEVHPWVRTFVRHWRTQFGHANLLQAPAHLVLVLLAVNQVTLGRSSGPLTIVIAGAAALTLVYQVLVVTMDAHYEVRRRDCLRLAGQFLVRFPGAPLLLAATLALIGVGTYLVPGLLPVLSVGVALYLCTALCLSFFAANDRGLAAQPAGTPDPVATGISARNTHQHHPADPAAQNPARTPAATPTI